MWFMRMIVSVLVLMALLVGPAFAQIEKPKADREIFTRDKKCQCDAIYTKGGVMTVPAGTYVIIAKLNMVVCNGIGNFTCSLSADGNTDVVRGSATYYAVSPPWPGSCQVFYPVTLTLVHTFPRGGGEVKFNFSHNIHNPNSSTTDPNVDAENLQITAMRVKGATEVDH